MVIDGTIKFLDYHTYYRIAGPDDSEKTPLLLLHGGPGSTHNYFELLDALAEEDHRRFISYDQLGCGNSYLDGHPELWHMETWLEELITVRKVLGLDEVILLGQSWGGMLLLEYVCRYPDSGVKGIVLSSTLPSSRLWGEEQARMIRQLPARSQAAIRSAIRRNNFSSKQYQEAERLYMELHCSGTPDPDAPECLTRPKRIGKECYLTAWGPNEFTPVGTLKDFDVTDSLHSIRIPTLIISGGNDLCTPYIAKTMYDRIPNARWELFRDCRHMCFAEDTARYISVLKSWLNA